MDASVPEEGAATAHRPDVSDGNARYPDDPVRRRRKWRLDPTS